jgi:hypothetical protein
MTDQSQLGSLRLAAKYRSLRKILRRQAIGSLIFGALAIVLGVIAMRVSSINAVLLLIGAGLLVLGVLDLALPRPWLLLAEGVALLVLATWNVLVMVANAAAGGPMGFIWVVIIQVILGIMLIRRYGEYRDTPSNAPPAEMLAWLDQSATTIRKTRPADSPYIIEWVANRNVWGNTRWRAQLAPDLATVVDSTGSEVFLLTRSEFNLTKGRKIMVGKRFYMTAQLGPLKLKGTISGEQFERFQAWRWAGMAQPGQGVWVPHA